MKRERSSEDVALDAVSIAWYVPLRGSTERGVGRSVPEVRFADEEVMFGLRSAVVVVVVLLVRSDKPGTTLFDVY